MRIVTTACIILLLFFRCWLSIDDQFIWVFLAPVVVVIVVSWDSCFLAIKGDLEFKGNKLFYFTDFYIVTRRNLQIKAL